MTSPTLRLANPSDAYALAEMHVATWQVAYRGLLPDDFLDGLSVEARAERWQHILTGSPRQTWVACEVERVVGFVSTGICRDDDALPDRTGEIYGLYVHPDKWRLGIGALLMTQAVHALKLAGYADATLWVLRGNRRARDFYEASGFVPDGAAKVDTNAAGISFDEVRYRRPIE